MELIITQYLNGSVTSLQGGRPENQDDYCFANVPHGSLVVVCDGMGGGPGGKTASYLAKTAILDTISIAKGTEDGLSLVKTAIENANNAVFSAAQSTPSLVGMGTTAVVLLVSSHSAIVGHVGDSRLYKLRMGMRVFLTNDHSVVGDMVRQKIITEEQARLSTQSNILNRAIGVRPQVDVDVEEIAYEKGDRFVLCTDGVWGSMDNKTFVKECSKKQNLSLLVDSLATKIDMIGQQNGGHHDNLTLAIVETKSNSQIKEKMSKRSIRILLIFLVVAILSLITAFVMYNKSKAVPELKKANENLTTQLHQRDSIINSLESSIKLAKEENAVTKGETKNAQLSADIVKEENERLKQRVKELEAKLVAKPQTGNSNANKYEAIKLIDKVIGAIETFKNTKASSNTSDLKNNKRELIKALAVSARNAIINANIASVSNYINTITIGKQTRVNDKYVLTTVQKANLDTHIKNLKQKRNTL